MVYSETKPRGPIAAQYHSPGPIYNLPGLVGGNNHDPRSVHEQKPAYSFGTRHGKYKDDATSSSDAGIAAYNNFSRLIQDELRPHSLVTVPAEVPSSPGVDTPEIVFTAQLDAERSVTITTILVDNVRTAGAEFV